MKTLAAYFAAALACALPGCLPSHEEEAQTMHAVEAGYCDHHVHVLGPDLLRDWKSIGATFSRDDSAYLHIDHLLAGDHPLHALVLVPMAHFYGNEELRLGLELSLEDEEARVRAENDHVASQAARHADRAVAFGSVDLLRPYALRELQRTRRDLCVRGAKVHLASAGFDYRNAEHRGALKTIVAWTEAEQIPLLVHLDPQRRGTETTDLWLLLEEAFGPYPNAEILIAHLGGSGGFGPWPQSVLETCAAWIAKEQAEGRPRPRFYFDVAAVPLLSDSEGMEASSKAEIAALAPALRKVGLERVLFGSDYPVFDPFEHAAYFEQQLGFSQLELRQLRSNHCSALAHLLSQR